MKRTKKFLAYLKEHKKDNACIRNAGNCAVAQFLGEETVIHIDGKVVNDVGRKLLDDQEEELYWKVYRRIRRHNRDQLTNGELLKVVKQIMRESQ